MMQCVTAKMATGVVVNQPANSKPASPLNRDLKQFDNICRTCAQPADYLIPIFEGEGLKKNLPELINKHLPIMVSPDDGMPHVLCYHCATTVLAWHELKHICVHADEALRQRFQVLQAPIADEFEKQQQFIQQISAEQEKSDSKMEFYENFKMVLNKYLSELNIAVHGDMEFVCLKCDDQHSRMSSQLLAEHFNTVHCFDVDKLETFIKEYVIIEESLAFSSGDSDKDDRSVNPDKEPLPNYNCSYCECIFSSVSRLVFHLNSHKENPKKDGVMCCKELYTDNKELRKHLQEEHTSTAESNICRSCGYKTDSAGLLQKHIFEQHNNCKASKNTKVEQSIKNQKYIPAVCPECNKTFSNKYNMFVHMKSHSDPHAAHGCDQCARTYRSAATLRAHRRLAHRGLMPHPCPRCGEPFPTRAARDLHARLHSGHRPYRCPQCGKSYRAKNTLDRHMEMHQNIRKYECQICSKKFRKRSHLVYHVSTHKT
ncbi:zinc finger protein 660-like isoform X2 [Bombyx mandarina]|uniref:Zinc finger protein 660-like isoform X2 n=1 Tax=Bombyx mandarina TaxID=7092 RepID=A0A6J2JE22_BOMMA|nr:zinc finger protein 660-like isoform X2 [Bombyx mandarina]